MAKSGGKRKAPAPPLSDEEVAARVRKGLRSKGLEAAELAQIVGKAEAKRALQFARERAAAGELFQVLQGRDEWFFGADPIATLDHVVPQLLREMGPSPARDLKSKRFKPQLEQAAPGHSGIVATWLESAIARELLFELPQRGGKKPAVVTAERPVQATDEEIVEKLRAALKDGGRKARELSALVDLADGERCVRLARDRAASGELFRVRKGKDEWFFGADPIATLDRVVPDLLRQRGPLSVKDLKGPVEQEATGHSPLLADWQKGAIARELVFERTRPGPPRVKLLSAEPDLKLQLGKVLAELSKALPTLARQGITRERVLEFLWAELEVRAPARSSPAPARRSSREVFLEALKRFAEDNPKGALLPVRELRARAGLAKQDFDTAALALSKEGLLVLHHHDHAATLSEAEQSGLVRDALGRHYVGVALRGSA